MRSAKIISLLPALAVVLALQACASGYNGDIGGAPRQLRGVVQSVETRSGECRIDLANVRDSSYLDQSGGNGGYGGSVSSIYCDNQTRVYYQGQTYRPESLERGDEITADVSYVNGRTIADRVDVTYDVSTGGGYDNRNPNQGQGDYRYDPYGTYGGAANEDLRATVRSVDHYGHTLTLERVQYYDHRYDQGGSDLLTVRYDDRTRVTFRGQANRPENLEPGDVIAVRFGETRGSMVADDIQVLADARESAAYPR
jgi:hypothetical protein